MKKSSLLLLLEQIRLETEANPEARETAAAEIIALLGEYINDKELIQVIDSIPF